MVSEYFLTIKLSWNTTTRFPRHTFWWCGIDGSRLLAHMPPESTYNSAALPHSVRTIESQYEDKDVSCHAMLLFGIGDGGGGPGEEHLERLARVQNLDGLPPVRQTSSLDFFAELKEESEAFGTWNGELYLERHQGTFTTQARNKRFNRKLEFALHDLELISVVAGVLAGFAYPSEPLERIWKETLLYPFHDILPGSSKYPATGVFDETSARYAALMRLKISSRMPADDSRLVSTEHDFGSRFWSPTPFRGPGRSRSMLAIPGGLCPRSRPWDSP